MLTPSELAVMRQQLDLYKNAPKTEHNHFLYENRFIEDSLKNTQLLLTAYSELEQLARRMASVLLSGNEEEANELVSSLDVQALIKREESK